MTIACHVAVCHQSIVTAFHIGSSGTTRAHIRPRSGRDADYANFDCRTPWKQQSKTRRLSIERYALVGGPGGGGPINPDGHEGELNRPNEYGNERDYGRGGGGGSAGGGYSASSSSTRMNMPTSATPSSGSMSASSPPMNSPSPSQQHQREELKSLWDALTPIKVQGGSLRTWSFSNPNVNRVQVLMKTDGRPLISNIELWQGPDNTPQKMGVYIEDGNIRTFNVIIETPRAAGNAVAIRNTGHLEYPLEALVDAELYDPSKPESENHSPLLNTINEVKELNTAKILQGGAIRTYPFDPSVSSIQCLLTTDGRPLNARIELIQGPNNNKQIIELYAEDGNERPFFAIIETPGSGNVVRIVNTAPMEYPLMATVEPYMIDEPGGSGGGAYGQYDNGADGGGPMFVVGGNTSPTGPNPDSIY